MHSHKCAWRQSSVWSQWILFLLSSRKSVVWLSRNPDYALKLPVVWNTHELILFAAVHYLYIPSPVSKITSKTNKWPHTCNMYSWLPATAVVLWLFFNDSRLQIVLLLPWWILFIFCFSTNVSVLVERNLSSSSWSKLNGLGCIIKPMFNCQANVNRNLLWRIYCGIYKY